MSPEKFLAIPLLFTGVVLAQSSTSSSAPAKEAWSILQARCVSCHNAKLLSGGLRADSRSALVKGGVSGPAISTENGKAASSLLLQRVTGEKVPRMPLGAKPLPDAEIAALRRWIEEGAPENPAGAGPGWEPKMELTGPSLSLNDALDHYWSTHNVRPPAMVTDAVFARRVYLDLWGVPPPRSSSRRSSRIGRQDGKAASAGAGAAAEQRPLRRELDQLLERSAA